MFIKLGKALEDIIDKTEIEGGIEKGKAVLSWPKVVGRKIAARARPYLFKGGTLFVAADSSAWAQELSLMKSSLVERMNRCLGKEVVRDIRFQARPPARQACGAGLQPSSESIAEKGARVEIVNVQLGREAVCRIKKQVEDIADGELRKKTFDVAVLDEKFKVWQKQHGFRECPGCGTLLKEGDHCRQCLSSRQER